MSRIIRRERMEFLLWFWGFSLGKSERLETFLRFTVVFSFSLIAGERIEILKRPHCTFSFLCESMWISLAQGRICLFVPSMLSWRFVFSLRAGSRQRKAVWQSRGWWDMSSGCNVTCQIGFPLPSHFLIWQLCSPRHDG